MIPIIILLISTLSCLVCFILKKYSDELFTIISIILGLFAVLYLAFGIGAMLDMNGKKIQDYKELRLEMILKCPGINTEYESFTFRKEIEEINRTIEILKKDNLNGWSNIIPDEIDFICPLTQKEIEECVRIK